MPYKIFGGRVVVWEEPEEKAIPAKKSNKDQTAYVCKYCGGLWQEQVAGTINGVPVYNAVCTVCGLTTKDFPSVKALESYLGKD